MQQEEKQQHQREEINFMLIRIEKQKLQVSERLYQKLRA